MEIVADGEFFVANIKFEQRLIFKKAGWSFHPVKKKWVTKDVHKAADFWEFASGTARQRIDAYRGGAGAVLEASWATDSDIEVPAPDGATYLPFQRAGVAYAVSKKDCLIADPPGLGKTIQAIGTSNTLARARRGLVVCPASLKINWQREFTKWTTQGLTVGVVTTRVQDRLAPDGTPLRGEPKAPGRLGPKLKETVDVWPDTDVVIINKELFERHNEAIKGELWDFLIVDEAHAFCNPKAKSSQHIWGYGWGKKRVHPIRARKRIFLTGTPITTKPINLWPFVKAMDPDGLGKSWEDFVFTYCGAYEEQVGRKPDGSPRMRTVTDGASNLDDLNRKLRQAFMVRREKEEVLKELPPKRREIVLLPNDGIAKQVEQELSKVRAMLAKYEDVLGIEDPRLVLNGLNRLFPESIEDKDYDEVGQMLTDEMQVAFEEMSEYRKALAIAKAPMVKEHVDRLLESGEKVILFCYHKEVAEFFRKYYDNQCAFVTGKTPSGKRQDQVDMFQNDPDCRVFIGNIAAAGVGFTLTASHFVVFAELSWVPSELEQAEDRAWRIGQDHWVLVQHLVVDGSMDARMIEVIIERLEFISQALDARHVRDRK
jgi:SWI/SNF-related matrix-associated actin-dependent regulator 1 of chromatin subfamily A